MNVLIVDDNELFRILLRTVLSASGGDVSLDEAGDCASAAALLKEKRVAVAYFDISLPDGSGLDLLTQLRGTNPGAVIACCTCHDLPEYRDEARRRGADFFFSKESLTPAQVLSVLAEGRRRASPPVAAEGLGASHRPGSSNSQRVPSETPP